MKAHIVHILRSQAWGGLELYALDFIKHLQQQNISCEIVCHRGSLLAKRALESKIKTSFAIKESIGRATHVHVHRRQDLALTRILLLGTKLPLFYSLYMSAPYKKDVYHAWIYRRVTALASSSEWVNSELKQNFPVKPDRVHLIRYGREMLDPHKSAEERQAVKKTIRFSTRQAMKTQDDQLVITSMSRLDKGKGILELAQAVQKLEPIDRTKLQVWIIGDPTIASHDSTGKPVYEKQSYDLQIQLQKLAETPELKGTLHLMPFQQNPNSYLQASDIFYLGSHEETYSLAVIDAMLQELPVLGASSGGTVEQIGAFQERGYFFKPANVGSLHESIKSLLTMPRSEILQKGKVAGTWASSEHQWSRCLAQWRRLYKI